jgi:release factor glutamine methyltransferase
MQVKAALDQAASQLREQGVESPRLDAELLLAHVLDVNRAALFTWPERRLTPKELTGFRDLVGRRAAREPLAYIVGHREFYGLDFCVDSRALVPRPETEMLVEHVLRLAQKMDRVIQIADVGSGSGAIVISIAVRLPRATLYALDDSEGALALTAENARRHGVADRVHCVQGDLLEPLPVRVDVITANLPYVSTEDWHQLPAEIRDYEPRAALDGGADGLDLIRRMLAAAPGHLQPGGVVLLEIGAGQARSVTKLARAHFPSAEVEVFPDYAGLDRLVVIGQMGSSLTGHSQAFARH